MTNSIPKRVTLFEVGPRDGLQNENQIIPTDVKAAFIHQLAKSGLKQIEVTSFVHPKSVPQLADADELLKRLHLDPDITAWALVPNQKGFERAMASGIKHIAVFTAASETFVKKNINMTIDESLAVFQKVIQQAIAHNITVRGYVSTAFVCPYEGKISKEKVMDVVQRLLELGVIQVSIGDTIGAAVPSDVTETIGFLQKKIASDKIALHLHDTYGNALANAAAGLELGITTFDTSAGGLGGCPYAPGAAGNLATEDLLTMLDRIGIETGVNLSEVTKASSLIAPYLKRNQWQRLKSQSV